MEKRVREVFTKAGNGAERLPALPPPAGGHLQVPIQVFGACTSGRAEKPATLACPRRGGPQRLTTAEVARGLHALLKNLGAKIEVSEALARKARCPGSRLARISHAAGAAVDAVPLRPPVGTPLLHAFRK